MLPILFLSIAQQTVSQPPVVKLDCLSKIEDKKVKSLFSGRSFGGQYIMRNTEAPDFVQGYVVRVSKYGMFYIHLFNDQIHSITSKTSKYTWEAFTQSETYNYSEEKPEFPFKKFEPVPVPEDQLYAIEFGDYGIRFAVQNESKTEEIPRPMGTLEGWRAFKTEFGSLTNPIKGTLVQVFDGDTFTLQSFTIEMSTGDQKSAMSGNLVKGQYGAEAPEDFFQIPDQIKKNYRLVPPLK